MLRVHEDFLGSASAQERLQFFAKRFVVLDILVDRILGRLVVEHRLQSVLSCLAQTPLELALDVVAHFYRRN